MQRGPIKKIERMSESMDGEDIGAVSAVSTLTFKSVLNINK